MSTKEITQAEFDELAALGREIQDVKQQLEEAGTLVAKIALKRKLDTLLCIRTVLLLTH